MRDCFDIQTRAILLHRCRNRADQAAWSEFFSQYVPMIRAWGRKHGLSHTEADDFAGYVLLALIRRMQRFVYRPEKGRFRGWLKRLVERKVKTYWRKLQRQNGHMVAHGDAANIPDPISLRQFSEEMEQRVAKDCDVADEIVAVIKKRFALSWPVFERTFLRDESPQEAAAASDLSVAAVNQAKYRVLKALKEEAARRGLR